MKFCLKTDAEISRRWQYLQRILPSALVDTTSPSCTWMTWRAEMGQVWKWKLSFEILGQLPITKITLFPSLLLPSSPNGSLGTADSTGAAGSLLTRSPCWGCPRHSEPTHMAPGSRHSSVWLLHLRKHGNAYLKLTLVIWARGIKVIFHGRINSFQTCPPDEFHKSIPLFK